MYSKNQPKLSVEENDVYCTQSCVSLPNERFVQKKSIGLFKMFSRWIWHIFNTLNESEIGWEQPWMMHEIKDEDLLANCMQKQAVIYLPQLSGRCLKLPTRDILYKQIW